MESDKFILGYWRRRGRGQILRHLLAYTGLPWEDKVYVGLQKWFGNGDKTSLGLQFPNLPYLIKGDFKLTETSAIMKYIAKKSDKKDLMGKNAEEQARVQMVLSLLDDLYNPTYALFFSPNHANQSTRLFDGKIKEKLDLLVKFIGEKDFILGYLTVADFKLAEASFYFEKLFKDQYPNYKAITRIRTNVHNLPQIKKYYESQNAVTEPFLPDYAKLSF